MSTKNLKRASKSSTEAVAQPAARGRQGGTLDAARRQVRASPFAAIAGAAAVSAGLALLLPASRREAEVMGDVADKLGEVARGAADSAVEAGRAQAETLAQAALASVGGAVIGNVIAGGEGKSSDAAQADS